MKTDRFTDIIRRKLESIRPEFTDKDWTRMQATIKDANLSQPNVPGANHPFSGGIWSGQSWLLAAASISTVALIAYSVWQQREIDHLHQTIGQLNKQPTNQPAPIPSNAGSGEQVRSDVAHSGGTIRMPQAQQATTSANRNESQAVRPDTVYITRYVPTPSRAKPEIHNEDRFSQHAETPPEQRYATENPVVSPATTRQPTELIHNQQTESHDVSSTPSVTKNTYNEAGIKNKPTNSPVNEKSSISQTAGTQNTKRSAASPSNLVDNQKLATNTHVTQTETVAEPSATANETSASYELATSLPLSVERKNWSATLAQRARSMRPALVATVVSVEQVQSPASQPVQRAATHFRAGIGGEVASRLWCAGVFTEVLLGKHWTLGVGISQATCQNRFITEEDFNGRTQRDFRKEFARPGDLWRDILNIDTRQVSFLLPINLGYRIPLNQTLTLLPTVGTYLNLTNSENVTYYCRDFQRPPMQPQLQGGINEISASKNQPVDLINNFALGAGLEWQRNHWVVQTIPVLTIPVQTNPQAKQTDLNWEKNTTLGLRARLLYQF